MPFEDDGARRPVDEVPGGELDLAVERFALEAIRVSPEELTRRVAWLFGWNRRGAEITRALEESIERLAAEGRLVIEDGNLLAPRK